MCREHPLCMRGQVPVQPHALVHDSTVSSPKFQPHSDTSAPCDTSHSCLAPTHITQYQHTCVIGWHLALPAPNSPAAHTYHTRALCIFAWEALCLVGWTRRWARLTRAVLAVQVCCIASGKAVTTVAVVGCQVLSHKRGTRRGKWQWSTQCLW